MFGGGNARQKSGAREGASREERRVGRVRSVGEEGTRIRAQVVWETETRQREEMGVKWGNDECGALEPGGGGGKTRGAEAGRDWPRKGGSPVDGSGQEEPKRDESHKDQSDT